MVPFTQSRAVNSRGTTAVVLVVHRSAAIQTFLPQQVLTAHTPPLAQSADLVQAGRPLQGVDPSTQKPVASVVLPQTQDPPGPQGPKVEQVFPEQPTAEQAPLTHLPDGHLVPHFPQLLGSVKRLAPLQLGVGAVTVTVFVEVKVWLAVARTVVVLGLMPKQLQALL